MPHLTRGELNDLLAGFATKSPKYRTALKANAKDIVERQLNSKLPESIQVRVVEDARDTMHIVLPYVPVEGAELSAAELETVAGGFMDYTCNFRGGTGLNVGTQVNIL